MMGRMVRVILVASLLVLGMTSPATAENPWEREDGFFTLINEAGKEITQTALILGEGDAYIDEDNKRYEVVGIDGDSVKTKFVETVKLPDVDDILQNLGAASVEAAQNKGPIALYHTHSGESYVPNSGKDSEETGDIYEVGKALKESLEREGYKVLWSKNNHNPHDAEAYSRSRRTATELERDNPVTVIDVHRDAIPGEAYETEINGEKMTKVRLVVGRQNQNREANLEYAKRIKAIADKQYPGFIKGIFDARGNYNQDLGPKMMLIEVGTHENKLEWAEKAASVFAKILPAAAGMTSAKAAQKVRAEENKASSKTLWWVIGIAVVLVGGYLLLNSSSLLKQR